MKNKEIETYPKERIGINAIIYDKGYEDGYTKGQEDALNGLIQTFKTITIKEKIDVIPELREYFMKQGYNNCLNDIKKNYEIYGNIFPPKKK
jgi:flagellar biosynthesis/type III secretory pathway protein FliH